MMLMIAMIFVMIGVMIVVWIIFKRVYCASDVQFSAMVSVISLPIRVAVARYPVQILYVRSIFTMVRFTSSLLISP